MFEFICGMMVGAALMCVVIAVVTVIDYEKKGGDNTMTEEQTVKIAWLNRTFHAEKAAKAWLAKLERDRSLAERLSRGFGGTGGNAGNSTEDALIRLAQTEEETQDKLRELVRIREEICEVIRAVDDMDMQAILVSHYLAYQTFPTIAERMHYDKRTVQRKHKQALDRVVILKNQKIF